MIWEEGGKIHRLPASIETTENFSKVIKICWHCYIHSYIHYIFIDHRSQVKC